MMALNFAISAYSAIESGNPLALAGGIIGGAIFGCLGRELALGIASQMGASAFTFGGGALLGGVEFGMSGFGAGFGSSLASGESFSSSLRAGGIGAAFGAVSGAAIEGSYLAGWQHGLHGLDAESVGKAAGVQREVGLSIVSRPLPAVAKSFAGGGLAGSHWGLQITDNYNQLSGAWDFDYIHNPMNDTSVILFGDSAPGIAQASTLSWTGSNLMSKDANYIMAVHTNIQENLGSHSYKLDTYTCQTWANNRLALKNDHFSR